MQFWGARLHLVQQRPKEAGGVVHIRPRTRISVGDLCCDGNVATAARLHNLHTPISRATQHSPHDSQTRAQRRVAPPKPTVHDIRTDGGQACAQLEGTVRVVGCRARVGDAQILLAQHGKLVQPVCRILLGASRGSRTLRTGRWHVKSEGSYVLLSYERTWAGAADGSAIAPGSR